MLPSHVVILGTTYAVLEKELPADDLAEMCPKMKTITIDSRMPEEAKMDALHHEIAHAALAQTDITKILKDGVEEAVVQTIGTAFRTLELKY